MVQLRELIVSGEVTDRTMIYVFDVDGKFLVKGNWFQDWVLLYSTKTGKVEKSEDERVLKFCLTDSPLK